MSGETNSPLWLRYVPPCYYIQQRRGVLCRYEIQTPELGDWVLGWVEKYTTDSGSVRWRTLDHKLSDWRDNFTSRERAAQDLVRNCPKTIDLLHVRRERLRSRAEKDVISPEL